MTLLSQRQTFNRNRLTWLAYLMLAYIAVTQSILGPLMPTLRKEMTLNYTLGSLLPTALATGLIFSGLTGDWLARRFHRQAVFWGGSIGLVLGVILLGFPIFWLARSAAINVLGLFITGLGIANLYPLTLSMAAGVSAGQSNQASARASLAVGIALLSAPLLLGWLADRLGIEYTYGIVLLFAGLALAIVINNQLLLKRTIPAQL